MANSAFNRSQLTYPQSIKDKCDFRLTLVTGTPVMTTTQSAKTTVYMTPYKGNEIALYDGSNWALFTTAEISLSLAGLTASKNYDIWCYNNGGTPTLEALVWTDDTTRATALTTQDGVYVKTGATTRRYIGTIRINSTGGQCNYIFGAFAAGGTAGDLGVWNYYNRVIVQSTVGDSTDSWTYGTNTIRAADGSNTFRTSFVVGVSEDALTSCYYSGQNGSGVINSVSAIGYDATNAVASGCLQVRINSASVTPNSSFFNTTPAVGYHFVQAVEKSNGGTTTFYGDNGSGDLTQTGLTFVYPM